MTPKVQHDQVSLVAEKSQGNKLEEVSLMDVVVNWQGLTPPQRHRVDINADGLPELEECPELLQRAEGLLEAVHAGAVTGLTHTRYQDVPLHPSQMRLNRASAANWIAEVEKRWALRPRLPEVPPLPELAEAAAAGLCSIAKVEAVLGICRSGVYRLVRAGKLDPPVILKGKAHWTAATVAARLESTRVVAKPHALVTK